MHVRRIVAAGVMAAMMVGCGSAAMPAATPAPAKPAEVAKPAEPPPAPAAAPVKAPQATKPAAAAAPAAASGAMPRTAEGYAVAPAAPASANQAGTTEAKASDQSLTSLAAADSAWLDRKIIRNATLSIWTESVESAVTKARQIADVNGGFVSASNTRTEKVKVGDKEEERQLATLTVQVPVQQFDRTIESLRQLGKVESEVGTSQDVTEEYVDLSANVQNLRKGEEAVQAMLTKATRLEDVMMLTRELTQIRGQIERLEGRRRFLEKRSDLSTVTLSVQPPPLAATPTPVPTPTPAWDPSRSAERGWNASLRMLRAVAELGILAVAFGWWLIPVGAIAAAVALRVRRPAAPPTGA